MISKGLLRRHQRRPSLREAALLDIVQDYALHYLAQQGVFEFDVILKGGTGLRKYRSGNDGRFSTDLDFEVPDADTGEFIFDVLDGMEFHDVHIALTDRDQTRARLDISTPLGKPKIPATVDASARGIWFPAEIVEPVKLPVHRHYEFEMPNMAVPIIEEALAEKLAAWYRRKHDRDLYDLYWYSRRPLNEALLRRMFVLKIWHDTAQERRNEKPIVPEKLFSATDSQISGADRIGLLVGKVDIPNWLANVSSRFQFLTELDETEAGLLERCNPNDYGLVEQLKAELIQRS